MRLRAAVLVRCARLRRTCVGERLQRNCPGLVAPGRAHIERDRGKLPIVQESPEPGSTRGTRLHGYSLGIAGREGRRISPRSSTDTRASGYAAIASSRHSMK
jgi:hypothetical protein